MKALLKRLALVAPLAAGVPAAHAGTVNTDDAFYSFMTTVEGWLRGGLGIGLALLSLLLGAAIGVAKNSPMPTLSGVALAAFIHWGPGIIKNLILAGALI